MPIFPEGRKRDPEQSSDTRHRGDNGFVFGGQKPQDKTETRVLEGEMEEMNEP